MKFIFLTASALIIFVFALTANMEAEVSASIGARATVIDPIGFKLSASATKIGGDSFFSKIIKPKSGTFQCQIEQGDILVEQFDIDAATDPDILEKQIANLSITGDNTLSVTIIYTEN